MARAIVLVLLLAGCTPGEDPPPPASGCPFRLVPLPGGPEGFQKGTESVQVGGAGNLEATARQPSGRIFVRLGTLTDGVLPRANAGCLSNDVVTFQDDALGRLREATGTLTVVDPGDADGKGLDLRFTGLKVLQADGLGEPLPDARIAIPAK